MKRVFNLSLNSTFRSTHKQPLEPSAGNSTEICPNFPLESRNDLNVENAFLKKLSDGVFWQYMLGFCVVNFDLDVGQEMEVTFPALKFSEQEERTIAFSAFPDSNSYSNVGETTFSFRLPSSTWMTQIYKGQRPCAVSTRGGQKRFMLDEPPITTDGYTYGFCYFVQQSDPEIRRGFFQKTLVLLTPLPWPGLWLPLIKSVGQKVMEAYFQDRERFNDAQSIGPELLASISSTSPLSDTGHSSVSRSELSSFINMHNSKTLEILRRACEDISRWAPPIPPFSSLSQYCCHPAVLSLPLSSGAVQMNISIPPTLYFAQSLPVLKQNETALVNFPTNPAPLYTLFRECITELWGLWELLLLCEPIIVVGHTPRAVSEVVWSLVELIKPIPYGSDFRPYITVQDPDFKRFISKASQPHQANIVLGVTNPLFSKDEGKWPNLIKVQTKQSMSFSGSGSDCIPGYSAVNACEASWTLDALNDVLNTTTAVESVVRKTHCFFSVDRELVKQLQEAASKDSSLVNANNILRRYFAELSERFLQPLNRYFDQVMCENRLYPSALDDIRTSLTVNPFKHADFLKFIQEHAPTLSGNVKLGREISELYEQFLKTPNFAMWLSYRTELASREFQRHLISLLTSIDIDEWVLEKSEVAIIDVLIHYRSVLARFSERHNIVSDKYPPLSAASTVSGASFFSGSTRGGASSYEALESPTVASLKNSDWIIVPSTEQHVILRQLAVKLASYLPPELQLSFQSI